jgi:hypothetical protein
MYVYTVLWKQKTLNKNYAFTANTKLRNADQEVYLEKTQKCETFLASFRSCIFYDDQSSWSLFSLKKIIIS